MFVVTCIDYFDNRAEAEPLNHERLGFAEYGKAHDYYVSCIHSRARMNLGRFVNIEGAEHIEQIDMLPVVD